MPGSFRRLVRNLRLQGEGRPNPMDLWRLPLLWPPPGPGNAAIIRTRIHKDTLRRIMEPTYCDPIDVGHDQDVQSRYAIGMSGEMFAVEGGTASHALFAGFGGSVRIVATRDGRKARKFTTAADAADFKDTTLALATETDLAGKTMTCVVDLTTGKEVR
jgi:hypothetical protein